MIFLIFDDTILKYIPSLHKYFLIKHKPINKKLLDKHHQLL